MPSVEMSPKGNLILIPLLGSSVLTAFQKIKKKKKEKKTFIGFHRVAPEILKKKKRAVLSD